MNLIDKYLPEYTFSEYHSIEVNCPVEVVYACAKNFDMSKSKLIKLLFTLRGLPTQRMNLQGFLADMKFTVLEEKVPCEYLAGFWLKKKIEPIPDYEAFIQNTISAGIKVVWNFHCKINSDDKMQLSTETRILCVNPKTKLTFGLYWLAIRPFSGLIRKKMLQIIKEDAEAQCA